MLSNCTAGDEITVDELIWEILEGDPRDDAPVGDEEGPPRAIREDASICLILDCCRCYINIDEKLFLQSFRNTLERTGNPRQSQPPTQALAVQNQRGFNLKMKIRELGFNDQILIINSSLLGDTAKDSNSFTQRLLRLVLLLLIKRQLLRKTSACHFKLYIRKPSAHISYDLVGRPRMRLSRFRT